MPFIKVTLAIPRLIAPCKRLLEHGFSYSPRMPAHNYHVFESNIDFEIR